MVLLFYLGDLHVLVLLLLPVSYQEQNYARLSFLLVIHTGLVLCSLKSERASRSFVDGHGMKSWENIIGCR